jgi:hypothetical protein
MAQDYSALIDPLKGVFPPIDKLIAHFPELATLVEGRRLLRLMSAKEILEVRNMLGSIAGIHDSLVFAFANDAGDYLGVWVQSALAFGWAWYRHDQSDLMPVIRDTKRLKQALAASAGDSGLPASVHDYPDVRGTGTDDDIAIDRQRVAALREQLGDAPTSDNADSWFNFTAITQLTPREDVDSLMEYLASKDRGIQEHAVMILGAHRHPPARVTIEAIAAKGEGNARIAAETVLSRW